MGVKKQVFASISERELYKKLSQRWGDRYRIYPNLPFLFVFDTENLIDWYIPAAFMVSDADYARLKKTSIDFTICDDTDQPLLCVEFDGMQQGFNTGTQYHSKQQTIPWRRQYTELKLRVALGSFFPFIVIGSQYCRDLSREAQLSILDGIIGDILANRQKQAVIGKGFDPCVEILGQELGGIQPPNLTQYTMQKRLFTWMQTGAGGYIRATAFGRRSQAFTNTDREYQP